jgi:hypothetical protein
MSSYRAFLVFRILDFGAGGVGVNVDPKQQREPVENGSTSVL